MLTPILTPRLALAASFVEDNAVIIDVGTDHAYLPVWLLLSGKCSQAIAADINAEPLERARQNITKYGLNDRIRLILCDGLAKMDASMCDTVVIAGMGGETIAGILEAAPWTKDKTLILQPMTNAARLRRFLRKAGYIILDEATAAEERHLYTVIKATGGICKEDPIYDHISRPLLDRGGEEVEAYLDRVIAAQRKAYEGLRSAGRDTTEVETLLSALQELKKNR